MTKAQSLTLLNNLLELSRICDLATQGRFGGCAEAVRDLVEGGDRIGIAPQFCELYSFVYKGGGDCFAQERLGRRAEAGDDVFVNDDRFVAALEDAERRPLVK